ncbi:MAG: class I SAM-dependent methyltransferase, partial [Alphaproteobacteria bacterium]
MSAGTNERRSTQFYAPGVVDEAAWFSVAAADYEALIAAADFAAALAPVRTLFDAGCGTGRFPTMLGAVLGRGERGPGHAIRTDILDPSAHCLARYREQVSAPFVPGQAFRASIETFAPPEASYDLVWAVQSAYAWERARLGESLAKLSRLAGQEGALFIMQAAAGAFYHRFHDGWRSDFSPETPAYITAEEVMAALERPAMAHKVLSLEHVIPARETGLLQAYL